MNPEIYVSTDIETDGPCPGINSMLSFGSAAFTHDGTLVDTFAANLDELPGAIRDQKTMKWWAIQPEAWAAVISNTQQAAIVIPEYVKWVKNLPGKPIFVAFPAGFDFTFMYYYLCRFAGGSPFGFSALDMKTYAMARLGTFYRDSTKKNWPKAWFEPSNKHSHIALDDAIEQGNQFIKMLHEVETR